MKAVLFSVLALLAAPAAFAESCEPYTISEGDNFRTVYPCGTDYVIKHRLCREGAQEIFVETTSDGDRDVRVIRTCKNGSFYPKSKPVKVRGCQEGKVEIFIEAANDGSDRDVRNHYVCKNGKFQKLY